MTQANPFTNPSAPGGGAPAPRPRDLVGCLVAYAPKAFTPAGAAGNTQGVDGGEPRDHVTADLYVLETPGGQPIAFGGSPEWEAKPTPHDRMVIAPARFSSTWISNQTIVTALAPGGQPLSGQMILGRVVRSNIGRRPFNLMSVEGTPDMQRAVQIWSQLQLGQLAYREATALNGGPLPAAQTIPVAPSVSYAPPMAAPLGPPAWAPTPPPTPPQPVGPPAPAGWDPTIWASLSPQQQQQVMATVTQTPTSTNPW